MKKRRSETYIFKGMEWASVRPPFCKELRHILNFLWSTGR